MKYFISAFLFAFSLVSHSQPAWPIKPIKIISPYVAGGDNDIFIRKLQPNLEKILGQTIYIENRPGAGGNIGATELSTSSNDGYTWMIADDTITTVNPWVLPQSEATNKIQASMILTSRGITLVCKTDLEVDNFNGLVKLAKTKSISFANSGVGTPSFIQAELLKKNYNLDMVSVPFNGNAPVITALIGKHVDCTFLPVSQILPLVESKIVKPIVYSEDKRSILLPNTPSFIEVGYRNWYTSAYRVLFANKNTPEYIVNAMISAVEKSMKDNVVKQELEKMNHSILALNAKESDDRLSKLSANMKIFFNK